MMSMFDCHESDSETDMELLFKVNDENEDVFYFEDTVLTHDADGSTEVIFTFSLSERTYFKSTTVIDKTIPLERHGLAIFSIGMCALTWFWMGFATKRIVIKPTVHQNFTLTKDMIDFWQAFYRNVLLEFVFLNRTASADICIEFTERSVQNTLAPLPPHSPLTQDCNSDSRVLVPLGGGKDSLVAWHLTQTQGRSPTLMYVADGMHEYQSSWRLGAIVKESGSPFQLVRHDFSDENFRKFARSYLQPCGHPWAALVLFDAVLVCSLNGIRTISLGFEKSADEGNGVHVGGVEVNHQYDKSSAFVALASEYVRAHIDPGLTVFSPLKDMWEIEITRKFCQEPRLAKFHPLFISCNEPKENNTVWCAACDKCAFMFLLLSAWLPSTTVVSTVFHGTNMLQCGGNDKIVNIFLSLIGCNGSKPFDCVGTVNEAKASVHMTAIQCAKEWITCGGDGGGGGSNNNSFIIGDDVSQDNNATATATAAAAVSVANTAEETDGSAPTSASNTAKEEETAGKSHTGPLPVILCVLCERAGIELDCYGLPQIVEYSEVLRRWGLVDDEEDGGGDDCDDSHVETLC